MGRKDLKRDIWAAELARVEDAARSVEEFENVIIWWDRLDENRERKQRYHEQRINSNMFDWRIFNKNVSFDEDIIGLIHMCICEMHNLVDDPDLSRLIDKATDKQKRAFFPRYIVGCPTTRISQCRKMTDRNVRKLTDLMLDNLHRELYIILKKRAEDKTPMTTTQREFLKNYKQINKRKC